MQSEGNRGEKAESSIRLAHRRKGVEPSARSGKRVNEENHRLERNLRPEIVGKFAAYT